MKQRKGWKMRCDVGKARAGLENELWRRWSDGKLILQPFRCFTYVTVHSPTLLLLLLHHSSAHFPSFQSLHLRHSSFWFYNISVTSPTSQLILQPFPRFTLVTTHSPTLLLLYLRHSSFSNPSVASPTSHLILQPFFRFSYVTGSSLTSPGEPPMLEV